VVIFDHDRSRVCPAAFISSKSPARVQLEVMCASCHAGRRNVATLRWAIDASTVVGVDITSLIETRPGVRSGKPCFVGTRIAVYDVLEYLASGMSSDEIVSDFPELTAEHVRAAIEFAALRERRLATA
jgi:uncharacterized protein (DUF433 family)